MALPMLMAVSCLSPVRTQIFISASARAAMLSGTPWDKLNKQLQVACEQGRFSLTGSNSHASRKGGDINNLLQNASSQPIRAATLVYQPITELVIWLERVFPSLLPQVSSPNISPTKSINRLGNQQNITLNGKIETNLLQLVLDSSGSQQKQIL